MKIKPDYDTVVRAIEENLESVNGRLEDVESEVRTNVNTLNASIDNLKSTVVIELYSIPNREFSSLFHSCAKLYMLTPAKAYHQFFLAGTLQFVKVSYWSLPHATHYPTMTVTNISDEPKIRGVELVDFTHPETRETAYAEDATQIIDIEIGDKLYIENPSLSAARNPIQAIFLFSRHV